MYKKISDYAIIGNLHSVALIGLDGSIDWLCLPHIDSPSVFGALLDDEKGGRFAVRPKGAWDSVAAYLPDTNILKTKFRTQTGICELTDFMPIPHVNEEEFEDAIHELYRLLELTDGEMDVEMHFEPRFDYARAKTSLEIENGTITARGHSEHIILQSTHDFRATCTECHAAWHLRKGDRVWLHISYGIKAHDALDPRRAEASLLKTTAYWRRWIKRSDTGRTIALGPYRDMVNRSALALKLLYYQPMGTIAAAATTSLPESVGGIRNWDYRYTWVRDTAFTVQALFNLGHLSETEGYLKWIERLIAQHGADRLQIMYGLRGEEDLPEQALSHLAGYKGSRPVRIGNEAARQQQLDIYGELMDAALKLSDYVGKIDTDMWSHLRAICNYVVAHWKEKDSGIWEVRGGLYHYVYSKIMCWVALDRGLTIARRYGFPADVATWQQVRDAIKAEVLDKGFSKKREAFVQHYDTDALDASNLLIPILGFLPYTDPRVVSTIEATQKELANNGLLYRYAAEDGLAGTEGTFLLCTFWLIDNLIGLGRLDEAKHYLHRMEKIANHVGLFSEEYDIDWQEQLGNFPQAFTHIGYINSVVSLCTAKSAVEGTLGQKPRGRRPLLFHTIILNEGTPRVAIPQNDIAPRLKNAINILRGAFFDTKQGRVAYERMRTSQAYQDYIELTHSLNDLDLTSLKTTAEQLAFWINLYNVIVIHGVIELGIKDSVKEVHHFFKRIRYRIGGMTFSPDDIEHGVLRGNRRHPHALFKPFGRNDPRISYIVKPLDPRIHFAMVCASSSCPPIDVYTPEEIDRQLTIAGETFLNGGGIVVVKDKNTVLLSRVFKWYAKDFGKSRRNILNFIAPYLYENKAKEFLLEQSNTIRIGYLDYDWRLNRR